jgi:hypothetical protein
MAKVERRSALRNKCLSLAKTCRLRSGPVIPGLRRDLSHWLTYAITSNLRKSSRGLLRRYKGCPGARPGAVTCMEFRVSCGKECVTEIMIKDPILTYRGASLRAEVRGG